jgi:hypothetical protein
LIPSLGEAGNAVLSIQSQMSTLANSITSLFTSIFGKKWGGIIGGIANIGLSVFGAAKGGGMGKLPGLANGGSIKIPSAVGRDSNVAAFA